MASDDESWMPAFRHADQIESDPGERGSNDNPECVSSGSDEESNNSNAPQTNDCWERGLFTGNPDAPMDLLLEGHCAVAKIENEEAVYFDFPQFENQPKPKRRYKKREKRTPVVPGATVLNERDLFTLRIHHLIPDGVEMRVPTVDERADNPPEGYFTCMKGHFDLAYLWFPIPKVVVDFFALYKVCFAQVTPQAIRNIVGVLVRSYEEHIDINTSDLMSSLTLSKSDDLYHYISPKARFKILSDYPGKDHDWKAKFFFVKLNSASVEGDCSLVCTRWRVRGRDLPLITAIEVIRAIN